MIVGALAVVGWPASQYRGTDFPQFWLAPRELLAGRIPYAPPWGFPYPMWTILLLLPLGLLPFAVAAALWLVAQLVSLTVAMLALGRRLFVGRRRETVLLVGLAAGFQPTWLLVAGGNMTGFLAAAFVGALAAQLGGRPFVAGALLGLLVVKPHPFLLAGPVFVLAAADRPRVLAGAAPVVVGLVATSFAVRPGWLSEWQGTATALQGSVGSNATLWTIDRAVGGGSVAVLASTLIVLAGFGVWWWWARPAFAPLVGGAVAASLALAPHGWSYDHLLLLVPAAVVLRELARVEPRVRLAGTVALFIVAGPLPWALYALAFPRGGEEWSAVVPVSFLALVILAERLAGRRQARSAPASIDGRALA